MLPPPIVASCGCDQGLKLPLRIVSFASRSFQLSPAPAGLFLKLRDEATYCLMFGVQTMGYCSRIQINGLSLRRDGEPAMADNSQESKGKPPASPL